MARVNRGSWLVQLVCYGAAGLVAAAVDFSAFWLLTSGCSLDPLIANLISRTLGGCTCFILNKVWTFEDRSRGGEAMLRGLAFAFAAAISLGIATGAIWLAAKALPAIVAKVLADLCAFAWTYAAARFMVFRQA